MGSPGQPALADGIWPAVSHLGDRRVGCPASFLNAILGGAFRTRIIGRVDSKQHLESLALHLDSLKYSVIPGEFQVWTGDDWLSYRLPLLGDLRTLEV